MTKQDFHQMPILLPPIEEQRRIADFLDAELKLINAASRMIRHQMDVLDDRRKSVLSTLLSPYVGAHRSVKLGYLASLVTSGPRGWGEFVGSEGRVFFRSANLQPKSIEPKLSEMARVQPPARAVAEAARSRIVRGDVLVGITGANTAWVALADDRIAGGSVSQHVCLIRPDRFLQSAWLAYILSSPMIQELLLGSQYGGTKTQLSLSDIRNLPIPIVPIEVQATAAAMIAKELGIMEDLRQRRLNQVALLDERRQALITAAVTGQLDVTTARGADLS